MSDSWQEKSLQSKSRAKFHSLAVSIRDFVHHGFVIEPHGIAYEVLPVLPNVSVDVLSKVFQPFCINESEF